MNYNLRQPCNDCPFRKNSAPGWTGGATPDEFITATLADVPMPCHLTVDYEKNDWLDAVVNPETDVEFCAGARIFFANTLKSSRNPDLLHAPPVHKSSNVFANAREFLAHHNKIIKRGKQKVKAIIPSIFK